jgi:hypothetical protein
LESQILDGKRRKQSANLRAKEMAAQPATPPCLSAVMNSQKCFFYSKEYAINHYFCSLGSPVLFGSYTMHSSVVLLRLAHGKSQSYLVIQFTNINTGYIILVTQACVKLHANVLDSA